MTSLKYEAIKELQYIYHNEYGKEISENDARILGERLITFFKIIYRPIPNEEEIDSKGKFS